MGSSLEGGRSGSQDNVAVQAMLEVQASAASLGCGDVRSAGGEPRRAPQRLHRCKRAAEGVGAGGTKS